MARNFFDLKEPFRFAYKVSGGFSSNLDQVKVSLESSNWLWILKIVIFFQDLGEILQNNLMTSKSVQATKNAGMARREFELVTHSRGERSDSSR